MNAVLTCAAFGLFILVAVPAIAQEKGTLILSDNAGQTTISADTIAVALARPPTTQPYLGVTVESPSDTLRSQLKLPQGVGLVVQYIDEKAPAHSLLKQHDILEKLDDQLLVNGEQLQTLVRLHNPGDTVHLTLLREGSRNIVAINLGQKETTAEAMTGLMGAAGYSHVLITRSDLTNLSPAWDVGSNFITQAAGSAATPTTKPVDARMLDLLTRVGADQVAHATIAGPLTIDDGQTICILQSTKNGMQLTVVDRASGKVSFSGSVGDDKQWRELPEDVRSKLEGYKNLLMPTSDKQ